MLIIVCGLPGTGKTLVARMIARRMNAELLRTDVIRKEFIEQPTYSEQEKQKVYELMFQKAKELLQKEKSVVLDATFAREYNRTKALRLSPTSKIVRVVCEEKIVKERIKKRVGDESDAHFEQYLIYQGKFEPIKKEHVVISNSKSREYTKKQVEKEFST